MGINDPTFNIGAEFAQSLYADAKLVTNEVQPYYLLHKDTIRNFLHEKIEILNNRGQVIAYGGIEVSIVATIFTATFNDWHGIKGSIIEGSFFLSSFIFGLLTIIAGFRWISTLKGSSVNALTDELGQRGVIIASNKCPTPSPITLPEKPMPSMVPRESASQSHFEPKAENPPVA